MRGLRINVKIPGITAEIMLTHVLHTIVKLNMKLGRNLFLHIIILCVYKDYYNVKFGLSKYFMWQNQSTTHFFGEKSQKLTDFPNKSIVNPGKIFN